jgi:cell division protein FtsL
MATMALTNVRRGYGITPEIYFPKPIDNSRLVKVADPRRQREMALLLGALGLLLVLFLLFCWQHYSAIEYGYRNETLRQQRDQLLETRRQLQLDEAQLKEPWRIDELAHQLGLQAPVAGQVMSLEAASANAGGVALARAAAVSVISATQ